MTPWSFWSFCITATATAVALAISWQLRRIRSQRADLARPALRLLVLVWIWMAAALAASLVGFFQNPARFTPTDLSGFLLFGTLMSAPLIGFLLGVWRSAPLRELVAAIPTPRLVGLQVYRLGGVIFLALLATGQVPAWWGWSTGIADLLVGMTAMPLAWGLAHDTGWARPTAIGWNLLGLADFAHAIGFVFLVFFGLIAADPAPVLIGRHPLALIALFQVPLAIIIHGVVIGRLVGFPRAEAR